MKRLIFSCCTLLAILSFQNCSKVSVTELDNTNQSSLVIQPGLDVPPGDVTDPALESQITPAVESTGVVTVLLALGDKSNQQLVINPLSAQIIAQTAVRYSSPVENPRILVVRDRNNNHESFDDTEYIARDLLKLYSHVDMIDEPAEGLMADDLVDFDLVWFNNPGYPLGSKISYNTLLNFAGGVVLSGDDISSGKNFNTESLTGLKNIDNGNFVVCNGESSRHDNNSGNQYRVTLAVNIAGNLNPSVINFRYGNDIDNTAIVNNAQVIAHALGGPESCQEQRPVITRYRKQ